MRLRTISILIAGLSVASSLVDVSAQGFPGRDRRGGAPREAGKDREARRDAPAATSQDPFSALERELPSLQVDLLVKAEQLDDWRVFERDVRDIAEMERSRRRHLIALKDAGDKPASAITFVASLAEDERLRAEATADLKRHLEALYTKLDESQRRTLDRRTIQSQMEPLGPVTR